MKKGDKGGQFYLVAAVIIAGILISISYVMNYSIKSTYYDAEEVAQELRIESGYVMDYELNHPANGIEEFDDFSAEYSYYARDKDIYFIIVDVDNGIREAYIFNDEFKVDMSHRLNVGGEGIQFELDGKDYTFDLEKGKNFYFIIDYYKGRERYVYSG